MQMIDIHKIIPFRKRAFRKESTLKPSRHFLACAGRKTVQKPASASSQAPSIRSMQ